MPNQPSTRATWLTGVLDRFERPLLRYAQRHVGRLEVARDLVQECFLRLCRQEPPPSGDHLAPWLYRVVRNLSVDHLRKDGRMHLLENPDAEAQAHATPRTAEAQAEEREGHSLLLEEVASLPPRQQEVVRLKFQDGLSYKQIAEVIDVSAGNVGWLLHTALASLRTRLSAPSAKHAVAAEAATPTSTDARERRSS